MKTFKNLLFLSMIALLSYACEPEELPANPKMDLDDITANTGEYSGDDLPDRKGNE